MVTLLLALAVSVAGIAWVRVAPAGATEVPGSVSATPTSGLSDGRIVRIHAEVHDGVDLYEIRARVCRAGVAITNTFEYSADYDHCPSVALSPSAQPEASVLIEPGVRSGDLELQIGTGTVQWHNLDGAPTALTCGRDDPCQLVVQLQITGDTAFWATALTYSSSVPLDPPTPPTSRPWPDEDGHAPPAASAPTTTAGPTSGADDATGPGAAESETRATMPAGTAALGEDQHLAAGEDGRSRASNTDTAGPAPWIAGAAALVVITGSGVAVGGRVRNRRR